MRRRSHILRSRPHQRFYTQGDHRFAARVARQALYQWLRQGRVAVEALAFIEPAQVGMAEQPDRAVAAAEGLLQQLRGDALAALWRGDEQPGKPMSLGDGCQREPADDLPLPGHPQLPVAGRTHRRVVRAVELVQQWPQRFRQLCVVGIGHRIHRWRGLARDYKRAEVLGWVYT